MEKLLVKTFLGDPDGKVQDSQKKAEPKPRKANQEEEKIYLKNLFFLTVKGALYDRDFSRAFGNDEYLDVYSARWSPSRSLCYASILLDLQEHFGEILPRDKSAQMKVDSEATTDAAPSTAPSKSTARVISIGGGAAEVVAFGGFLKHGFETSDTGATPPTADDAMASLTLSDANDSIELLLVDTASWANVVKKLHTGITTPPPISKYASASAKAANSALVKPEDFTTKFLEHDVLAMSQAELGNLSGKKPVLVTLFFTLNELYTASISKTTAFLLNITSILPKGSLLLVVDSPGSYSETTVGTEEKKYPMKFLLDHFLIETQKSRGKRAFLTGLKSTPRTLSGLDYPKLSDIQFLWKICDTRYTFTVVHNQGDFDSSDHN
ncbi:uncharacterized protein EAF02_005489 [Botrytis sinoallii]|uniref:uncharacterized protein n=1 Tax=Botrytis sinoallii TaxID=1463999 RepID=UPI001900EBC3|nr:uncharacterized protein EAF02_005489 [Botrytis sinoallii]KAF7883569.1 hypothetical protein EAF02_005489 [Botrytis sinoallii]